MRAIAVRLRTDISFLRSQYSSHCQYRQNIATKNSKIHAFVHVSEHAAEIQDGLPLSGLKVGIKDNIATTRFPTTCSSSMLRDFVSPFDATVVQLLQKSGADIIGKTNCDEFGMGSFNVNSSHGPVKNPNSSSIERSAGGSSGGSAAAVAAGMCNAGLGTDTGGSVRLPASYCGVVGLKPSYGLISRWGVVSYADSLDCVGILATDVQTAKVVFDQISSYDPLDPTSVSNEMREKAFKDANDRLKKIGSLTGLKIGIPQEYFPGEISQTVIDCFRSIISRLKLDGAIIVPISLASTSYALSSYYVLASAEASSNLARYDGVQYGSYVKPGPETDFTKTSSVYAQTRSANFGKEVQKRILLGSYALSADAFDNYFLQALRIRQLVKDDFNRVFNVPDHFSQSAVHPEDEKSGVDIIMHPSAIGVAPPLSEVRSNNAGLDAYVQDVLTVPASLAGLPAMSVPLKRTVDELPIGVSVVGQWGTDEMVLSVGRAIEELK